MRPYAFRELKVWQRSMELTLEIYRLTKDMPANERFGLAMQLRRAAASVPTNIAEEMGERIAEIICASSPSRAHR